MVQSYIYSLPEDDSFFGHFPFDGVRKYIKTNGYVLQRFHATQARVIYIIGVPKELYYKAWLQSSSAELDLNIM